MVIAAVLMLVTYGTISPCDAARAKIENLAKAQIPVADEDTSIIFAAIGHFAAGSISHSLLHKAVDGQETPMRCAKVLWRLETFNEEEYAPSISISPHPGTSTYSPPNQTDELVEKARLCATHIPQQERAHGIPNHLLASIAATESGYWHKSLGLPLPWPWAVTVNSKRSYFKTKDEAIAFVRKRDREALTIHPDIYVGCMQINLKYRPKSEQDLKQAFDPSTNVAWAATLLEDKYRQTDDWQKAVSMYDSTTGLTGQKYLALIEKNWTLIVGKAAHARDAQAKK